MTKIKNIEVQKCIEWISLQKGRKTINKNHTSYHYKHLVEKWSGVYISDDSFIEAIKLTGIPYKESGVGNNIWVALSEKLT